MYSINYESAEALNLIAVSSRDNNNSHIGNATPSNIAKDMVKLIPDDWFEPKGSEVVSRYRLNLDAYANNHRVLDICCNSGVFLYRFLDRFRYALSDYVAKSFDNSEDKLCEFIIKNLLYGVCVDYSLCKKIRGILYNNPSVYGNIYHYSVLHDSKCDDDAEFRIEDNKVYIGEEEMKFDVVVGNPPYNDDMYLDFVMLGHRLSKQYSLWITPAKWQAKGGDKNSEFRSSLLPSLDYVIFYPEVKEIFNITLRGGISILLFKKSHSDFCDIVCRCERQPLLNGVARVESLDSLYPIYNSLRSKLLADTFMDSLVNLKRNVFVAEQEYGDESGDVAVRQGAKIVGYLPIDSGRLWNKDCIPLYKVCIAIMSGAAEIDSDGKVLGLNEIHKLLPMQVPKGSYPCVFMSMSELEVDSFISYMKTKLFRFLYFIGNTGSTISGNFFRFIPVPDSFDHIFTDSELYAKYNLSDSEIEIIELIIRKRR